MRRSRKPFRQATRRQSDSSISSMMRSAGIPIYCGARLKSGAMLPAVPPSIAIAQATVCGLGSLRRFTHQRAFKPR
jgi:hypothetical protein